MNTKERKEYHEVLASVMEGFNNSNFGRRVELIHTSDEYTKLRKGDQGTYEYSFINYNQLAHCINWDKGSHLYLIEGKDSFKFLD